MEASIVHYLQNWDLVLVRVSPSTRIPATTEDALEPSPSNNTSTQLSDVRRSYEAANYSRLIWVGMPIGGWVVDATSRSCMCLLWRKAGICLHVIKAKQFAELPCPGMPLPLQRFVTPTSQRPRNRTARSNNAESITEITAIAEGAVVYGPPTLQDSREAIRLDLGERDSSDAEDRPGENVTAHPGAVQVLKAASLHVLDNTEMTILCSATSCQQRQRCSCQGNNIQRASLCVRNLGVMKMMQSSPAFSTYFDL
ncbi:hypothetical protein JG688_00001583 [Phytophthora aleatoria]|uniref:SWIM-type domain-containing protein n=1 Tax=Phytophthora aleatoria TaxID=2496075 RepID=A0A8J5J5P5_9STRA|nr:hypothetical protein JG688_00001583 [Phytophthora aleatoria]